jgi:hypothetical protein
MKFGYYKILLQKDKEMKQILNALCVMGLLTLGSCVEKLPIPNYLVVPTISLESVPANSGTGSHNLKDVWVSVDGRQLGANSYPCSFPYQPNDSLTRRVRVTPGIYNNGVANTRRVYPFFEPFDTMLTFEPGVQHEIKPVFRYRADRKVIVLDNFEQAGVVFGEDLDKNTNSFMEKQTTDVFEGNASGRMVVSDSVINCVVGTSFTYSDLVPKSTNFPVYLELNYKCSIPFQIILRGHYAGGTIEERMLYGVNRIGFWNKIYFELTTDVASLGADSYSIALSTQYDFDIPDGEVLVDNIQLVHF